MVCMVSYHFKESQTVAVCVFSNSGNEEIIRFPSPAIFCG